MYSDLINVSRYTRVAGTALLLFLAAPYSSGTLKAQSRANASAIPDLNGIWFRSGDGCTPNGVTCPFNVAELPLKARALGFREAFDEPLAPKYDCVPSVVPSLVADPYKVQMEQADDRVVLTYEKDDIIRTVWLDGHGHAPPLVGHFFQQGYSRGWYEEDQLVVETTKFTFDPIGLDDMANLPSSTSKKVTERYWREGDLMTVEVTTEDPLILNAPIQFTWSFALSDEPLYLPYGCDPALSKEALEFLPPKYVDPDFVRITVAPYGEQSRD
ncbi:MAG: hypothetical protein V3R24_04785 [Gemmatimonadales bacterium]